MHAFGKRILGYGHGYVIKMCARGEAIQFTQGGDKGKYCDHLRVSQKGPMNLLTLSLRGSGVGEFTVLYPRPFPPARFDSRHVT